MLTTPLVNKTIKMPASTVWRFTTVTYENEHLVAWDLNVQETMLDRNLKMKKMFNLIIDWQMLDPHLRHYYFGCKSFHLTTVICFWILSPFLNIFIKIIWPQFMCEDIELCTRYCFMMEPRITAIQFDLKYAYQISICNVVVSCNLFFYYNPPPVSNLKFQPTSNTTACIFSPPRQCGEVES